MQIVIAATRKVKSVKAKKPTKLKKPKGKVKLGRAHSSESKGGSPAEILARGRGGKSMRTGRGAGMLKRPPPRGAVATISKEQARVRMVEFFTELKKQAPHIHKLFVRGKAQWQPKFSRLIVSVPNALGLSESQEASEIRLLFNKGIEHMEVRLHIFGSVQYSDGIYGDSPYTDKPLKTPVLVKALMADTNKAWKSYQKDIAYEIADSKKRIEKKQKEIEKFEVDLKAFGKLFGAK